jgi:heptosyltransferase-2
MNLWRDWIRSRPVAGPVPDGSRYRYSKRRYRILFGALDAIATPLVRTTRALAPRAPRNDPRSILVVQLDHVGDAVLSTPMLRALNQRFPDAAVDVLASAWNHEIFQDNPHVRQVHVSQRNWQARGQGRPSHFGEALRLGRRMRRWQYDLGIDPRGDFLIALLLRLAGIPRRLGWGAGGGGFLLTDSPEWDPRRHEVDARLALLEPLGINRYSRAPELFPSWSDQYAVREALAALPELREPLVILHVSAGTSAKRWPVPYLAELVKRLLQLMDGTLILVGDRPDRLRARHLARVDRRVVDWTGRLPLMQLASLLEEAALFIGADSGPAHIAAAMGTPSVILFSGTNRPECWRPSGHAVHILRWPVACSPCHLKDCPVPSHPCMTGIRPSDVIDAVEQILPGDLTARKRSRRTAS